MECDALTVQVIFLDWLVEKAVDQILDHLTALGHAT
jgi:hypothetical protein